MESIILKIGDYEVEVRARKLNELRDTQFNERDTQYFLNDIGWAYSHAADHLKAADSLGLSKECVLKLIDIHTALDKLGFFDDLRDQPIDSTFSSTI